MENLKGGAPVNSICSLLKSNQDRVYIFLLKHTCRALLDRAVNSAVQPNLQKKSKPGPRQRRMRRVILDDDVADCLNLSTQCRSIVPTSCSRASSPLSFTCVHNTRYLSKRREEFHIPLLLFYTYDCAINHLSSRYKWLERKVPLCNVLYMWTCVFYKTYSRDCE